MEAGVMLLAMAGLLADSIPVKLAAVFLLSAP